MLIKLFIKKEFMYSQIQDLFNNWLLLKNFLKNANIIIIRLFNEMKVFDFYLEKNLLIIFKLIFFIKKKLYIK